MGIKEIIYNGILEEEKNKKEIKPMSKFKKIVDDALKSGNGIKLGFKEGGLDPYFCTVLSVDGEDFSVAYHDHDATIKFSDLSEVID